MYMDRFLVMSMVESNPCLIPKRSHNCTHDPAGPHPNLIDNKDKNQSLTFCRSGPGVIIPGSLEKKKGKQASQSVKIQH